MNTENTFQLGSNHPHHGKCVRLVEGDLPNSVQGVMINTLFMALCEDEAGQRYYATATQLRQVHGQDVLLNGLAADT